MVEEDEFEKSKEKYDAEINRVNDQWDPSISILTGHRHELARDVVQRLFLMNGAALIALPAISELSEIFNSKDLMASSIAFGVGLLFALTSYYLMYLNSMYHEVYAKVGKARHTNIIMRRYQHQDALKNEENFDKKIRKLGDKIQLSFVLASMSGFGSAFALILGVLELLLTHIISVRLFGERA